MVTARGEGGVGRWRWAKGGEMGTKRDFTLGDRCMR